jgi:hypothetical protein
MAKDDLFGPENKLLDPTSSDLKDSKCESSRYPALNIIFSLNVIPNLYKADVMDRHKSWLNLRIN